MTFFALFMMSGTAPTGDDPSNPTGVTEEQSEPLAANETVPDAENKNDNKLAAKKTS